MKYRGNAADAKTVWKHMTDVDDLFLKQGDVACFIWFYLQVNAYFYSDSILSTYMIVHSAPKSLQI